MYKPKPDGGDGGDTPHTPGPGGSGAGPAQPSTKEFFESKIDNHLMEADYTIIQNVKDNLEDLKQERIKGKFRPSYHA